MHYLPALGQNVPKSAIERNHESIGQICATLKKRRQIVEVDGAITRIPKPFHLLNKNGGRSIDLIVRMRKTKKIVRDAVVGQDRHTPAGIAAEKAPKRSTEIEREQSVQAWHGFF